MAPEVPSVGRAEVSCSPDPNWSSLGRHCLIRRWDKSFCCPLSGGQRSGVYLYLLSVCTDFTWHPATPPSLPGFPPC